MKKIHHIPTRLKIADELKAAILSGEIAASSELVQENIAQLLGVSRTPVREAFQMLEKDGFITLINSKKAIVRRFEHKDVEEHYELRALLEGQMAFKAAMLLSDTTLLHQLVNEMDACVGSAAFIEKNAQFHNVIWQSAQSPKYVELISHLWNRIPAQHLTLSRENQIKSNLEHRAILDAFDQRNPDLANQSMQKHIIRTLQDYLKQHRQP